MVGAEVNKSKLARKLLDLGLSTGQADLYLSLLKSTGLRINALVELTRLPRSTVYEYLRGLVERGLVEEVLQDSYKVYFAAPISMLEHRLKEHAEGIQQQRALIESLGVQLEHWRSSGLVQPTVVRYYRGVSGARQLFWNTLKATDTLYVYSEWGRGRYLGIDFYKRFVAESYKRDFKEKVITNPKPETLLSIKQHIHSPVSRTERDNIRLIDQDAIRFRGDTFMYDNTYAQVFLKDEEITGFEIESKQFVETQRAIFEALWETAHPISPYLKQA